MTNGSKLIWRGDRGCRSLGTHGPAGVKFYLEGEEVPSGTLAPAYEAQLIAEGKLESVGPPAPRGAAPVVHAPAAPAAAPAPPVHPRPATAPPVLQKPIEPLPVVRPVKTDIEDEIAKLDAEIPQAPEPKPVRRNPAADAVPETAPARTRSRASDDDGRHRANHGKKKGSR